MADPYATIGAAPDPYSDVGAPASPGLATRPQGVTVTDARPATPDELQRGPLPDAGRVAQLAGQGLAGDVQGAGDQIAGMTPSGQAANMLGSVGKASDNIAALLKLAFAPDGSGPPKDFPTREQFENPGLLGFGGTSPLPRIPQIGDAPRNATERLITTGASMAPAALGLNPGGGIIPQIIRRAATVAAPTIGAFGATEGGRALGANDAEQTALGTLGGVSGGIASQMARVGGPQPTIPGLAPEAPAVPLPHVIRALKYVAAKTGTPDPTMMAAADNGKPTTLFQRSGQPGTDAMLTLTAKPGTTATALKGYAGSTLEPDPDARGVLGDFGNRAQDDFSRITGVSPQASSGNMTDLSEGLRGTPGGVRDAYDTALFDGGVPRPATMTPHLSAILQEPEVAKALNTSKRLIGTTSTVGGLQIDPATGAQAIDPLTKQPIIEQQPTAQTLDLTKKTLQKTIARNPDGSIVMSGDKGVGNDILQSHLQNLTTALAGDDAAGVPAAIPGYRDALNLGGDVLSMEHAFARGQSTIFDRFTPQGAHDTEFNALSPGDQEAWRGGAANAINAKAVNGNLGTKTFSNDAVSGKLNTLFGPDKTTQLLQAMGQEKAIKDSLTRAQARNNSTTGTIAEGSKDMDSTGLGPMGAAAVHGATMVGLVAFLGPGAAMGYGVNLVRQAIPRMVSNAFAMPPASRDLAGHLLMSPTMTNEDIQGLLGQAQAAKPRLVFRPPGLLGLPPTATP